MNKQRKIFTGTVASLSGATKVVALSNFVCIVDCSGSLFTARRHADVLFDKAVLTNSTISTCNQFLKESPTSVKGCLHRHLSRQEL